MQSDFPNSLRFVLEDEGGNVDDPQDRGGRTSRGITQATYDADRRLRNLPVADVFDATDEEVANIYRDHYWLPWCDRLPFGIDYLFFDAGVNSGPHRAIVLLQRAIGVADDGVLGPITWEAVTKADTRQIISRYSEARRRFYRSLNQPRFLRGWLDRAARAEDRALSMLV